MADKDRNLPGKPATAEVETFLKKLAAVPALRPGQRRGRLIFAMDATASREPSWDRACQIQAEMFQETAALGGLDVQLVYYRGFGQCQASRWTTRSEELLKFMLAVRCQGGHTQIAKVLRHAIAEVGRSKVDALVFVGDCMEEPVDDLCALAGRLGLLGMPVFVFQEGSEPIARATFKEIARLSGGAHCSFSATSAAELRRLLGAVAVFAAGGRAALEDYGRRHGGPVLRLTREIKGGPG
jgi:hypothetical protein